MTEPTVCAILLTRDRPEMARRAVQSFRAQTYQACHLLAYNSGELIGIGSDARVSIVGYLGAASTIGALRNEANRFAVGVLNADILIHFDDDDFSHPNRIAEQVALLQSSGADVVGYNEMLFWREPERCAEHGLPGCVRGPECVAAYDKRRNAGEAWLYSNPDPSYALGTSLCYWRKTWERKPFQATSYGEDLQFCIGQKVVGVSSLAADGVEMHRVANEVGVRTIEVPAWQSRYAPRMVARIHGGNTSSAYAAQNLRAAEWRRVAEWDDYARKTMEIR